MKKILELLEELESKEPGNIYSIKIYTDGIIILYNDNEAMFQFNNYKDFKQYVKELYY